MGLQHTMDLDTLRQDTQHRILQVFVLLPSDWDASRTLRGTRHIPDHARSKGQTRAAMLALLCGC